MARDDATGRAMASCGSCGHTWHVEAGVDPQECPECGYKGAITVSLPKRQRTKRQQF